MTRLPDRAMPVREGVGTVLAGLRGILSVFRGFSSVTDVLLPQMPHA
jgi:hypothetical protein